MEKSDGESRRSDGQDCPPLLKIQGLVVKILVACIVYSLAYTLITHASQHNPDGSHKTVQIQGTTCRWAGGALVEKRETFNAQRSTPNFDGPTTNGVWVAAAAGMRPRPDCTRLGATCPHYRQSGGRCKLSRRLCRAPAERLRLSSGFAGVVLGAEDLPHLRWCRDLFDGQIHVLERFLGIQPPVTAATGESKPVSKLNTPEVPVRGSVGRLSWDNDFNDIDFGGVHYDLTNRDAARHCIRYLVMMKAFNKTSARHLENEINPYVREQVKRDVLKHGSDGNLRIQHYFCGSGKNYLGLRKELVKAAGRNGCFYLQVF
jgi:hypothetical protein